MLISNKVNIWRDIQAGGAGLVENDDLAGTEALLRAFLALDPSARDRMGVAARRCFLENYDMKTTGSRVLALFKELIGDDGDDPKRSRA